MQVHGWGVVRGDARGDMPGPATNCCAAVMQRPLPPVAMPPPSTVPVPASAAWTPPGPAEPGGGVVVTGGGRGPVEQWVVEFANRRSAAVPAAPLLPATVPIPPAALPMPPGAVAADPAPAPAAATVPSRTASRPASARPARPAVGQKDGGIPASPFSSLKAGPLELHAYGLLMAGAAGAGYALFKRGVGAAGLPTGKLAGIVLPTLAAGLVGARLYHVASEPERYEEHPVDALKIWNGGLGIYGGVALGALTGSVLARRAGLPVPKLLDAAAAAIALGQGIGRWGNYANQELYGTPTDKPWGLQVDPEHRPEKFKDRNSFHPTFLYESVWNVGTRCGPARTRDDVEDPCARHDVRALRRRLRYRPLRDRGPAHRRDPPVGTLAHEPVDLRRHRHRRRRRCAPAQSGEAAVTCRAGGPLPAAD